MPRLLTSSRLVTGVGKDAKFHKSSPKAAGTVVGDVVDTGRAADELAVAAVIAAAADTNAANLSKFSVPGGQIKWRDIQVPKEVTGSMLRTYWKSVASTFKEEIAARQARGENPTFTPAEWWAKYINADREDYGYVAAYLHDVGAEEVDITWRRKCSVDCPESEAGCSDCGRHTRYGRMKRMVYRAVQLQEQGLVFQPLWKRFAIREDMYIPFDCVLGGYVGVLVHCAQEVADMEKMCKAVFD
jgi:hypothetical protein